MTLGLKITNHCQLSFRRCFRKEVIHTGLGSNGRSSNRIVAGDHNGLDAHFPQICKFLLHTLLDNILQIDNAENLVVLSHNQRCAALGRNRLDNSITVRRIHTACMGHITLHGICCAFSDFAAVKVDAAHTGHGSKWDKVHILVLKASATNSKLLLCQHNNASALGGFIGQRRKLSGVRQFLNINTIYRNELRCLSIAQGDCSGFVKHQNVYITGGFNGTTTHGQNICLVQSGHTGNTDGGKQGTNGSRRKAHQQRYQSCYRGGILNSRQLCRKNGISVERDCHQDKDNGQGYQKNLQSNFVGRLLPGSTFYHRNHLVQKALSGFVGHSDNDPVRQYSGAAGHSAAVAACLTNYRSGFAGDGAFIHRCRPFYDFAVCRNLLSGFDNHQFSFFQQGGLNHSHAVLLRDRGDLMRVYVLTGCPERICLCFTTTFCNGLGKVGK